jgi:myo-inositol 2-dehydrogenase / D-chiro-inositol 1-dehydrogenase
MTTNGGAAGEAAPFVFPRGPQEPTLRVGLVGCGGRGRGAIENVLEAAPNVQVTALADMFPDRVATTMKLGKELPGFKVADEACFTGFDAVKRLLDSNVDYVMLCQPPGFRPAHFELAVEAGKHVFMEKPVAVDPAGVRKVIAAGEKARAKKLGVIPGTQSRHSAKLRETVRRIHQGQIGEVVAGRISFNTGYLWEFERSEGMSDLEWQIRNWYYFDWLSGDHIVEQHVHQIDATDWVLKSHPVGAVGVGGRQVRIEPLYGNIYDHFAVDYEYPNDVHVFSMCRQWKGTPGKVEAWFTGTRGEACLAGPVSGRITGRDPWKFEGEDPKAQVQEHRDLIESIRAGKPLNDARRIAETTLSAILGREAAYTGKSIAWDDLLKSDLDLTPPKLEFGPHEARPVRRPGKA